MRSTYTAAYQLMLKRLVIARRARRLTQADVANMLGIPRSRVSRIETGERRLDAIELSAFAKLYRKRLDYFVP